MRELLAQVMSIRYSRFFKRRRIAFLIEVVDYGILINIKAKLTDELSKFFDTIFSKIYADGVKPFIFFLTDENSEPLAISSFSCGNKWLKLNPNFQIPERVSEVMIEKYALYPDCLMHLNMLNEDKYNPREICKRRYLMDMAVYLSKLCGKDYQTLYKKFLHTCSQKRIDENKILLSFIVPQNLTEYLLKYSEKIANEKGSTVNLDPDRKLRISCELLVS